MGKITESFRIISSYFSPRERGGGKKEKHWRFISTSCRERKEKEKGGVELAVGKRGRGRERRSRKT